MGKGLLGLGKKAVVGAGKLAVKHPVKSLIGVGLAGTAGGRKLLTDIPKKLVKGGEVLGKVYGGEETGLDIKGALKTAGLVGAGAIAGKMVYDYATGKWKKEKVEKPSLPGLTDIGFLPGAVPVGKGAIPVDYGLPMPGGVPGAVTGAPGQKKVPSPIQNVIQIAVR